MEWKSSRAMRFGAAILTLTFGGLRATAGEPAAPAANGEAAANGGWAGIGPSNAAAAGNFAEIYNYAWTTGYDGYGGYPGGTCCNSVWDGYCADKRKWCEKHGTHCSRLFGSSACRGRGGWLGKRNACSECECGTQSSAAATVTLKSTTLPDRPVLKPIPTPPN
jgi:hypothetical protein